MKVNIDSILSSAQILKRQNFNKTEKAKSGSIEKSGDAVNIDQKVDNKLNSVLGELKSEQNELTKNQVLRDGLSQLEADLANGAVKQQEILENVTYQNKNVLKDYLAEFQKITTATLSSKSETVEQNIKEGITSIKTKQIEAENLLASNLTETKNVEDFSQIKFETNSSSLYGSLNVETVRKLID